MKMKYTRLGKTDINISRITHGCMELGGGPNPEVIWEVQPEEQNIDLLLTAVDNGINSFDTAEMYGSGRSEEIVGKALASIRKKCVIASKVMKENLAPDDLERALNKSLKRLNTDYLDLYYIHWPNPLIPLEGTVTKLARLKEQGIIRSIGVSNFSLAQLKEAVQFAEISAYQPEYNLLCREIEDDILPFCAQNEISVLGYNSLAKGILSGAFHLYGAKLSEVDFRNQKPLFQTACLEAERELIAHMERIAKTHEASVSQVAVAWTLQQAGVSSAIVGTQNKKHFLDNLNAASLTLTQDELADITKLSGSTIARVKSLGYL